MREVGNSSVAFTGRKRLSALERMLRNNLDNIKMDASIVELALTTGRDTDFELFAQTALQIVLGMQFEPTGGMHDGGQDGFLRLIVGRPNSYAQISIQKTYKTKILQTINRITESGRTLRTLTYVSPLHIPDKDIVENEVEKTTGVSVRICDLRWLTISMSTNPDLEVAFKDRYSSVLASLRSVTEHVQTRYATTERLSVLVYLENHERTETGQSDLLLLAIDAAIFMALKETSPERGQFISEADIIAFVEAFFPQIRTKASTLVPSRLAHLCTKKSNPRIRLHKQIGFALPYEVRSEFSNQNALLEQLDADFWRSVSSRAKAICPDLPVAHAIIVEDAVAFSLTKTFEQQGMNLMAASQGADSFEDIRAYEFIRESLSAATKDLAVRSKLADIVAEILRRIFYSGTDAENQYLYRLFKLYSIEFIIKGDQRVWQFFRNAVRKLRLIVGTE